MFRKITTIGLLLLLIFSSVSFAAGPDMTLMDKISAVEKFFYGTEQTGALIERVDRLHKDVYGEESREALAVKVDTLYANVWGSSGESPSFLLRLNAVEWALHRQVSNHPAKMRLEAIEQTLLGSATDGPFEPRLEKLLKVAYTDGIVNVASMTMNKDVLVKIKMISAVGTKSSRAGDTIRFEAANDVYFNSILVMPKGAQGMGKVLKVEEAKNFGRDGELQLSFDQLEAMDGAAIPVLLGDKAKEENKSLATAAGASIAGMAILGPIGIVGGAFVHGKDVAIPAGTEFYIQIKNDVNVIGLQVK